MAKSSTKNAGLNLNNIVKILFTSLLVLTCAGSRGHKVAKPLIIEKEQWGGQEHFGDMPEQIISKITIHHGGVDVAEEKDSYEYMRNLQRFSMNQKKWIDIPYHFCIDLQGNIFEARPIKFPGDTNTEYNPDGHALICVIGNYENQKIKPQQLEAVIKLSAWLAAEYRLGPQSISGHKDLSSMTVCPGEDLYKYIQDGTIQDRVSEILKQGQTQSN